LRPKTSTDNTDATRLFWNFAAAANIYLQDSGTRISEIVTPTYGLNQNNPIMYPNGVVQFNFLAIPFSPPHLVVNGEDDCYGERQFFNYHNPQLVLDFTPSGGTTTVGTAYYVDVESKIHNLFTTINGDIRRYLL